LNSLGLGLSSLCPISAIADFQHISVGLSGKIWKKAGTAVRNDRGRAIANNDDSLFKET
jgi:hypothetical protein